MYAKETIDARDLQELLTLDECVVPLRVSQPWNDSAVYRGVYGFVS